MCQLGRSGAKVHEIPEKKALRAFKGVYTYDGDRSLTALAFTSTKFERLRKGKFHSLTYAYHRGGTFRTVAPDTNGGTFGNGRGFWAWNRRDRAVARAHYSEHHVYEVRMWGRVVKHQLGYRAEYVKFVRRVK